MKPFMSLKKSKCSYLAQSAVIMTTSLIILIFNFRRPTKTIERIKNTGSLSNLWRVPEVN